LKQSTVEDIEMSVEASSVIVESAGDGANQTAKAHVIYNGIRKTVEFEFSETMAVLRERAIKEFGIVTALHTLSLFTTAGVEFGPATDQQTIRDAGIKRNEELLLRPGVLGLSPLRRGEARVPGGLDEPVGQIRDHPKCLPPATPCAWRRF
jgi:hypothetical protein